jgi:hypothetical protein
LGGAVQERDAQALGSPHFEDVGLCVHSPHVAGIRIQGSSGLLLGCLVLAVLFEPERVHATHEAVTGAVPWPRGEDSFDHVSQI